MKIPELWADIPGEEHYAVSNYGQVLNKKFNRLVTPTPGCRGFLKVTLYLDGFRRECSVHRLVAESFLEDYDEELQLEHINLNKQDNGILNLRHTERRVRKGAV